MNRLREYRIKNGLSQKELADLLGISFQAISHYEIGRKALSVDMAKRIGNVLEIN